MNPKLNNKLKVSILALLISGYFIHEMKLPCFYDSQGKFKEFGLRNDQTILPLWLALAIIGLIVYNYQIFMEGKYV